MDLCVCPPGGGQVNLALSATAACLAFFTFAPSHGAKKYLDGIQELLHESARGISRKKGTTDFATARLCPKFATRLRNKSDEQQETFT